MRAIKFRGKCAKDSRFAGEWVYGGLLQCEKSKDVLIVYPITDTCSCTYHVDPATVGQFTGLHDKNGKEIYEGDIIKIVEKFDDENVYTSNGVVCFEEGIYELQNGKHFAYLGWLMHNDDITKLEVIGNIHDDKKLLEKGGKK